MKKKLYVASLVMAVFGYSFIIAKAIEGTDGLSFSTFALWALLAWIIGFAEKSGKGDPVLALIYGLGASITACILYVNRSDQRLAVDTTDIIVAVMTVFCLMFWMTSGPRFALVLAILSGVIATVPFAIMTWEHPQNFPVVANVIFLVANVLAFLSADKWTLEARLYPGTNVLMGIFMLAPWVRMMIQA